MSPPRNGPSRTDTGTTTTIARLSVLLLAGFASTAAAAAAAVAATTTAATSATTPAVTLPGQILDIVPACATDCLATFVQNNYQGFQEPSATSCPGNTPSFACLCEHTGANGFTIGEAALSCLTLEAKSGACASERGFAKAFDAVKVAAYFMCQPAASSGESAGTAFTAAEQTHRTIVATAVVGSEFAVNNARTTTTTTVTAVNTHPTATQRGFSTITTGSLTSTRRTSLSLSLSVSSSSSSSSSSAAASTPTTLSPLISASSLLTTLITAPFPSTSSASTTATTTTASTSSSTAGNTPSAPPPRLSKAQIIGISIGSAAALIVAVGAYIALRAFRRRRDRESDLFGDMAVLPAGRSNSKDKDSGGFSRLRETKPGSDAAPNAAGNSHGHELQISSPMHLQQPAKYQSRQAPSFISPWHEKIASQQSSRNDGTGAQTITSPIPALRPGFSSATGVTGVARNPYAQQTPYTMPATIRPVNNMPSSTANTRQDTYAYNQPSAPSALTTKALPDRPGPTYDQRLPQSYIQPQFQPQFQPPPQPQPQPPRSYYTRGPVLPADWRPRPPASQQQQQPQSLQTMVEEDEDEGDNDDNNSRYPPPPPQGRIFKPPVMNRDSVVTEFAEDGEDEYSLRTSGRVSGRGSGRGSRGVPGTAGRASDSGDRQEALYSASNNNPYEYGQPYMSPSIVPRPLVPRQQQGQGRPLAAQRLGDDRAAALRLGDGSSLQQPRQKQNWQRMNSVIL